VIEIKNGVCKNDNLKKKLEELQYATGWLSTVPDKDSAKDLGIDKSFAEVYIEKPPEDYLSEWAFYAKTVKDEMPRGIMTDEPSLTLYRNRSFINCCTT
jgi:hypothetical protein